MRSFAILSTIASLVLTSVTAVPIGIPVDVDVPSASTPVALPAILTDLTARLVPLTNELCTSVYSHLTTVRYLTASS
jgi:hypothetical protein